MVDTHNVFTIVATLALCRGDFTHFLLSFFLKGGKGNNMDQKKIGLF